MSADGTPQWGPPAEHTTSYGQPPASAGPNGAPPLWAPWYGISFTGAFVRFWKKYVRFDGRASRSEYWWWYLWSAILGTVFSVVSGILVAATGTTTSTTSSNSVGVSSMSTNPVAGVPIWILGLALLIPTLALIVRRLHDANLSGLLALLLLIPFFGAIAIFIMMFLPSNPEGARFDRPAADR
ncbi:Uncharacterized membrane protein YhaH, DUF805 family [Curtobacterium sp. UNCCL20]|uniref:DUF805 domain-containing protein n=1 Tax=Curtobacterium sp. UNCCL20 TaxID=1502773 RepID=UPI00087E4B4D|nr:DUF805 domain-containing protein [Curtobacterium sp. UNCCL20]SDQ72158.1 Uncharacterized membrane protein YhaH, DUF805 family [Curtobacterium sp. UNCCL20]